MYVYLALELMPGILTLLVYLRCGIVKKEGLPKIPILHMQYSWDIL